MRSIYQLIVCLLLFACQGNKRSAVPFFNTPDFTPQFLSEEEAVKTITHTIPAFSFTDQHGKEITHADVKGKIYVADFFFTRCSGICPKMTNNMSSVAKAFATDTTIAFLSHSVTPEYDDVPRLKAYAEARQISHPNWHLLTGDKAQIYNIGRKGYFADERMGFSKDTTEFLHTENFILVDQKGRIRGVYNGTLEVEVQSLIKHMMLLKEE